MRAWGIVRRRKGRDVARQEQLGAPAADDVDPVTALRAARAELDARLAELRSSHEVLVDAGSGSNIDDEHDPEGATIAYERAQIDAVARAVLARLAEVDAALGRVADGSFGICGRCGDPIAPGRLMARPAARTCIACAALGP